MELRYECLLSLSFFTEHGQDFGSIRKYRMQSSCRRLGRGIRGYVPIEIFKIGLSLNTISCVPWTGIG